MKLVKKLPIMLNVDVCVHFYEGLFPPCDKTSHVTIATLVFASVVLSKREMTNVLSNAMQKITIDNLGGP